MFLSIAECCRLFRSVEEIEECFGTMRNFTVFLSVAECFWVFQSVSEWF